MLCRSSDLRGCESLWSSLEDPLMSKYFQTLSRLERQQATARHPGVWPSDVESEARPLRTRPDSESIAGLSGFDRLPLALRNAAFQELLETLRELASLSPLPVIVVAGVSSAEPTHRVVQGLMTIAQGSGLRVLVGRLRAQNSARILETTLSGNSTRQESQAASEKRFPTEVSFELSGKPPDAVIKRWFSTHGDGCDLALLEAPPVLDSADALLMVKAGAGLVVAATPGVTSRAALQKTTRRAKDGGAAILGVVFCEKAREMPAWLRRILGQ